jgi:hypothetical protein
MSGYRTNAGRRTLAGCIISALSIAAPQAATAAATWVVDSCNGDDAVSGNIGAKTGTLRFTIANAASGDTIDVSQIGCPNSKISLTTGEITITQASLTIKGPGATGLVIDGTGLPSGATGPYNSRPFTHTGSGTLAFQSIGITGGHVTHYAPDYPSLGGCVYSAGAVSLTNTDVFACSAYSGSDLAAGGGVYSKGNLTLKYSTLSGNQVFSGVDARGGGARTRMGFGAKYSTIDGNSVSAPIGGTTLSQYKYAVGGGISAGGNVGLRFTTVSNNYTNGSFGGISALGTLSDAPNNEVTLYSSTISGNRAGKLNGGIYANAAAVKLYNTTIAFNTAGIGHVENNSHFYFFGPGMALSGSLSDMAVTLQSSLLSNNTYGSASEFDLTTVFSDDSSLLVSPIVFNGDSAAAANNLVRTSLIEDSGHPLPPGTLAFVCPLLGPLKDNGGFTLTHALNSGSPAIDSGNNVLNYLEDQRYMPTDSAPYPYPRESNGVADIGAYEVNQDDEVFSAEFEGCPILI